jgi:3'-phosphoadenosine 5'-phosphosulfate sulfotransferase (PAPS reductase)/FAD synthetase
VYTDRPDYADLPAPEKFQAIEGIIITRLRQYPNAICSYSGGSNSDILIDMIERVRGMFGAGFIKPVKYVFFNTGLEMDATKRHVKETAQKYGVEIEECRPKKNIVLATRDYGQPFMSKIVSAAMDTVQTKGLPMSIKEEYDAAEDKAAKRAELRERYPKSEQGINFLCCCNSKGEPRPHIQLVIDSNPYLYEFMRDNPPPFKMSAKCCDCCKKNVAHAVQKGYEMIITGERRDEGGMRSVPKSADFNETMCFYTQGDGQKRFRPLYYVSDADKAWYKEHFKIRYSDAYEVYGLKRTGCCGCSISARAVEDLEKIRPYEPNVVKAAWHIFGDSYRYRQAYNDYKSKMRNGDHYDLIGD